ncbi:MAG TPA: hypothetical protein VJR23_03250 [Candidatus Acidoferrales bacterium]|nr:hypothetical protein [Candidatus Acidoferrales bacterium]
MRWIIANAAISFNSHWLECNKMRQDRPAASRKLGASLCSAMAHRMHSSVAQDQELSCQVERQLELPQSPTTHENTRDDMCAAIF